MSKKKIAILTQPLGYNYGGSIQNFALSYVLKKEGFIVETINRVDKNPNSNFKIFISNLKNTILKTLGNKYVFTKKDNEYIFKNHTEFLKKEINLSNRIDNTTDLKNYFQLKKFDVVIVGSDQTWRPSYSPNIYNYFLDFLSDNRQIKKIAYASSFGTDEWEYTAEHTQKCKDLSNQFNAISVREDAGVVLCDRFLDINAEEVLDPTLLLSKDNYLEIIPKNIDKRSGIFTYVLDKNENKNEKINTISSYLNLPTFINQPLDSNSMDVAERHYPSVYGWLKAFDDASFIVTDSFHGTVFSIIFNKPFIVLVNKERGASRFYSLLSKFGLEDRIVDAAKVSDKYLLNLLSHSINYSEVNLKLDFLKEKSYNFLIKNIV